MRSDNRIHIWSVSRQSNTTMPIETFSRTHLFLMPKPSQAGDAFISTSSLAAVVVRISTSVGERPAGFAENWTPPSKTATRS